jgi:hypothetical protein
MNAANLNRVQFYSAGMGWVLNAQQRLINEKGERQHLIKEEPGGQLRWSLGNFEPIRRPA